MDGSILKDPSLTLEEKLKLIDEMVAKAEVVAKKFTGAPVDPAELTICEGCS
jgi:hypothetical protein